MGFLDGRPHFLGIMWRPRNRICFTTICQCNCKLEYSARVVIHRSRYPIFRAPQLILQGQLAVKCYSCWESREGAKGPSDWLTLHDFTFTLAFWFGMKPTTRSQLVHIPWCPWGWSHHYGTSIWHTLGLYFMDMLPRMWVLLAICTIVIDNILWLKGKGTIYSHIFMYIFICLHIYIYI